MRMHACIAAGLILAACSSGQDKADYSDAAHVDPVQARAQARIDATASRIGTRSAARIGVPVSSPTPSAAGDRKLPVAFQGYWGVAPGDCDLRNADAAGRISVDADRLRLEDGKATVEKLVERSPSIVDTMLRIDAAAGAGNRPVRFMLEQGGTRLVMTRGAVAGTPAATIRYRRC